MYKQNEKIYFQSGKFLSLANLIEFYLNTILEQIIYDYSSSIKGENKKEELIDIIERQSIKNRFNYLILFISMVEKERGEMKACISDLIKINSFYQKEIKPIRDYIAHNPILHKFGSEPKFISSKRYKGNKDRENINIKEMDKIITKISNEIEKIHNIFASINSCFKNTASRKFI